MGRFGSQTSTYNRLVSIFVAVGSLVSRSPGWIPFIEQH